MSKKLLVTLYPSTSHFDFRWLLDHIETLKGVRAVEAWEVKKDLTNGKKEKRRE